MKSSELGPLAPGSGSGVATSLAGVEAAGGGADTVGAAAGFDVGVVVTVEDEAVGDVPECAFAGSFGGVRVHATMEMTKGAKLRSSLMRRRSPDRGRTTSASLNAGYRCACA